MLIVLFVLFVLKTLVSKMCMHPTIDKNLSKLYSKYENVVLDEFDNCDYVHKILDADCNDLVVMQLNIQGIGSKRSQLIDLIDCSIQNRTPDILLLSEMWLTPFSPMITIPGYDFYRQDRSQKKGGGVAILISNKLRHCARQTYHLNLMSLNVLL